MICEDAAYLVVYTSWWVWYGHVAARVPPEGGDHHRDLLQVDLLT